MSGGTAHALRQFPSVGDDNPTDGPAIGPMRGQPTRGVSPLPGCQPSEAAAPPYILWMDDTGYYTPTKRDNVQQKPPFLAVAQFPVAPVLCVPSRTLAAVHEDGGRYDKGEETEAALRPQKRIRRLLHIGPRRTLTGSYTPVNGSRFLFVKSMQ